MRPNNRVKRVKIWDFEKSKYDNYIREERHLSAITIRDFAKQYSDMEKIKDYEIQQLRAKLKEQAKQIFDEFKEFLESEDCSGYLDNYNKLRKKRVGKE